MSATVFANGMSIACKVSSGRTIAAMPDVCLSPPSPPAGPVPIPYPNTAAASDTDKGSKTVEIGGEPVMLKDQSVFKTSTGNEAATKSFGMSVVTHKIQGEASFVAWSMDVKFEGQNVPRHMDLMGHNEACSPTATPPWPFMDSMAAGAGDPCQENKQAEQTACSEYKPNKPDGPDACPETPAAGKPTTDAPAFAYAAKIRSNKCLRARRCKLQPYCETEKGNGGCCDGQTGHHLIEASAFYSSGRGPGGALFNCSRYSESAAPSICAEGTGHGVGTHGLMHTFQSASALECAPGALMASGTMFTHRRTTVADAQKGGAKAVSETFPESGCKEKCIEAQLSDYHERICRMTDPTQIKAVTTCKPDADRMTEARNTVASFGRMPLR